MNVLRLSVFKSENLKIEKKKFGKLEITKKHNEEILLPEYCKIIFCAGYLQLLLTGKDVKNPYVTN